MKSKVKEELKQHFRPEFLNRVDEIIVFPPLTQDQIVHMVDNMIAGVELRLKDRDMSLELTQPAKNLLAERGFDPVLGARPLRRTIQREIEDVLSEKMLFGEVGPGQIVLVDVEGEGATATFTFHGQKVGQMPDVPPFETAEVAASDAGGAIDEPEGPRDVPKSAAAARPAARPAQPADPICVPTADPPESSDGSASFRVRDAAVARLPPMLFTASTVKDIDGRVEGVRRAQPGRRGRPHVPVRRRRRRRRSPPS